MPDAFELGVATLAQNASPVSPGFFNSPQRYGGLRLTPGRAARHAAQQATAAASSSGALLGRTPVGNRLQAAAPSPPCPDSTAKAISQIWADSPSRMLLSPTMQLSPSQFLLSPGTVTSSLMQHTAANGSDGGGSKNIGVVAAAALEGSAPFAKLDRLVPQPTARELAAQQRQVAASAAAARMASVAPDRHRPRGSPRRWRHTRQDRHAAVCQRQLQQPRQQQRYGLRCKRRCIGLR